MTQLDPNVMQEGLRYRDRLPVDLEGMVRVVEAHAKQHPAAAQTAIPSRSGLQHTRTWRLQRWMVAAGAACVAVLAAFLVLAPSYRGTLAPGHGPAHEYRTVAGQQAVVTLADGSRIHLAPRTVLAVAPGFAVTHRTLALKGRAFFEVSSSSAGVSHPFEVRTGDVATRVLGTAFDISSYPEDANLQVVVADGKVSVQGSVLGHALTLSAGMVGTIVDSVATSRAVDDVARYIEWTSGRLVFRNAPADQVLASVSRWYGFEVRLADSTLMHDSLTVRVSTTSSSDALATIAKTLNVGLTVEGNVVTLHPRRTPSRVPEARERKTVGFTPDRGVGK